MQVNNSGYLQVLKTNALRLLAAEILTGETTKMREGGSFLPFCRYQYQNKVLNKTYEKRLNRHVTACTDCSVKLQGITI